MNFIMNIFYFIGNYGPLFLIFLSIFLFWYNKKNTLLFYFIIGVIFNSIFNILLKCIIQEPRPLFDLEKYKLIKNNKKITSFFYQNGIPFDMLGMPSGHSQTTFFITLFIWLSLKNIQLTLFYLFISLIIALQRIYFNFHTISQVLIGMFIGLFFGGLFFQFANNKLKGINKLKPDDFSFYN